MGRMGRFPICLNILLKKLSNIDLLHVIKLTKSSNNGENNLIGCFKVEVMKGIFEMVKIRELTIWLFFLNSLLVDLRGR